MFAAATTPPARFTLICLTGLSTLSLNMFLPSLVNIAAAFEADYSLVGLAIAGYLAMTAPVLLIAGPLSDRFGRRPVLLVALVLFCIASLGCLLAQSVWVFLLFRMMQAAVIAASALSSAIVRDMLPPRQAASMLGYIAMAMAVAPMLGPVIGGGLDQLFGWRASFVAYLVAGGAALALVWRDLGETNTRRAATFGQQLRAYPGLLGAPVFWGYALCMTFSTGAFFVFLAAAPLVTRVVFDMPAGVLGVFMGSITGGFFLGSFLSGRFNVRIGLTRMLVAGRVTACAGLAVGLALVALGHVSEATVFGATIFVGIGNGMTMPSAHSGVMSVRPDLAGSAAGLAGAMNVGGGAVLTTLAALIVTETTGAFGLLAMMLVVSALGLVAAVFVAWAERGREI